MATKPTPKKPISKKTTVVKKASAKKAAIVASSRRLRKPSFSFPQTVGLLALAGIILFGASGVVWWNAIVMDPKRTMEGMLRRSLSTASVTRTVVQKSQTDDLTQVVRLSFVPTSASQTLTIAKQPDASGQTNTITTEAIGTPKTDYVRYRSVDAPSQNGKFNDVLGVWGKKDGDSQGGMPASFLNEAGLTIVPLGDLKPEARKSVLKILQDKGVYTNYDSVQRKTQNGRPVFVYQESVKLADLIEALAAYAKATGLGDASQLIPEAYADAPPLKVEVTVDILSRQLVSINYPDAGRTEHYGSYGLKAPITAPEQTITLDELQKRVQAIK
jgi:hypothetical protein